FVLATIPLAGLPEKKLRIVRLKDGVDFKTQGPKPALALLDEIRRHPIVLDWYPRIQARVATDIALDGDKAEKNKAMLTPAHLAFMNFEDVWFDLQRFKNERAWYNLDLPREAARALLESPGWYTLYAPEQEMEFRDF